MAWMTDEEYELMQDTKEKRITARSARHARTHCGKGGRVKFPSDYLSKKELQAMNGNVKEYSMNKPMNWETFKLMPEDLQVEYIKKMRAKFNVPDSKLADAMGANRVTFGKYIRCLGLGLGKSAGAAARDWDDTEFNKFWNGVEEENNMDIYETNVIRGETENAVVEPVEAVEQEIIEEVTADIPEISKPIAITKPITWAEFKALPDEAKVIYIMWLRGTFGVPNKYIAEMFAVHPTHLGTVINKLGLGIGNRIDKTKPWRKEAFLAWSHGANPDLVEEDPESEETVMAETVVEPVKNTTTMAVNQTDSRIAYTEYAVKSSVDDLKDQLDGIEDRFYKMDMDIAKCLSEIDDRVDKLSYNCEYANDCREKMIRDAGPIAFAGHYMPVIPKSGTMTFEHNNAEDALSTIKCLLSDANVNLTISWECVHE